MTLTRAEAAQRHAQRRHTWTLDGFVWSRLPIASVTLIGFRRHFRYFYSEADGMYDFADDVRELVCEPIRGDVTAMWSDPREWLGTKTNDDDDCPSRRAHR